MKLTFKYELEKEYTNLKCGLGSLNHPGELPKMAQNILDQGIRLDDEPKVLKFFEQKMTKKDVEVPEKLKELEASWLKIADEAEKRFKKLFATDLDLGDCIAYLTVSMCCGYNWHERFFFVSVDRAHPEKTMIHELLHFYTHILYEKSFLDAGLPYENFNDFKEALTFLLNTDFSDLLGGDLDTGYEKQKDLRVFMEKEWETCENVGELVSIMIEKFKTSSSLDSANTGGQTSVWDIDKYTK